MASAVPGQDPGRASLAKVDSPNEAFRIVERLLFFLRGGDGGGEWDSILHGDLFRMRHGGGRVLGATSWCRFKTTCQMRCCTPALCVGNKVAN